MKVNFSGSVHYANGDPISNVVVRIYDRDASGRGDDDLTVSPGLSDEQGRFSLSYEPLRYLDFHTIHLPEYTDEAASSPADQLGIQIPDLGDL